MIAIRLSRTGRKKAPFYRVVAIDSERKASAQPLEILGFYNPAKKEVKIDAKKVSEWTKKGAKISPAVEALLK